MKETDKRPLTETFTTIPNLTNLQKKVKKGEKVKVSKEQESFQFSFQL